MTKATPPTVPNFATSRQKSETRPRRRSEIVEIMILHGRHRDGASPQDARHPASRLGPRGRDGESAQAILPPPSDAEAGYPL
ncbi:hypothetical protein SAT01_36400 [Sinomonas atrocyanea]|nr:hypothetical protein SAT01_36400 [Sinomonas atrocyanea]